MQREVAGRLLERLPLVRLDPARALDLGSGTGFVARDLRRRYPDARVIALDVSLQMLLAAPADGGIWSRLRARSRHMRVVGAMERLPFASESMDLVCSSLALEWSTDPAAALREVRRCLRPDGLFMFTTIGPDTLKELRQAAADVSLQPTTDMHNIGDALLEAGFVNPVVDMEMLTVTYADVDALFADLRATGSRSGTRDSRRGLRGRRWLQSLRLNYESMRSDGRLPATVEVIYGHCWKGAGRAARKAPDAPAVIQFHPRIPRS